MRSVAASFTLERPCGKLPAVIGTMLTQARRRNVDMTTSPRVWRRLSAGEDDTRRGAGDGYYDRVRDELLDMIEIAPRVVLDVGCGGGATDAELKRRFPVRSSPASRRSPRPHTVRKSALIG